ncbi:MAG: GNAT family N-acetyltransferase, partial [Xanthomonadales bacterium]|nr:GNAT family N-acetyltransferase [Xanthomonadales bacterium]
VKKYDEGWYELTKMGVLETSRGLKAGEILLKKVIEDCENNPDVKTLFLLTNKICEAAIHLYEKNGFVHDEMIKQKFSGIYKRSNVYMLYTGKKL